MAKERVTVTIMPSLGKQITVTTGNKKILDALNKGRHDTAYNIYIADMKLERRVGTKSAEEIKKSLRKTGNVAKAQETLRTRGSKEYREKEISAVKKNIVNKHLKVNANNFNFFDYAEELRALNNPQINKALASIETEVNKLSARYSEMGAYTTMKDKVLGKLDTIIRELEKNADKPENQRLLGAINPIQNKVWVRSGDLVPKGYKGRGNV